MLIAGLLEQSRIREFLYGPLFEVEVHDRDRVIHKFQDSGSLFGEERDDELLNLPKSGFYLLLFDFSLLTCLVCIVFCHIFFSNRRCRPCRQKTRKTVGNCCREHCR